MKVSQFLNFAQKPSFLSFKVLMVLLVCAVSFTSCNNDEDDDPDPVVEQNIAEIVVAGDDFSSLEAALIKAGLVETFQGSAEYTVFAPTNAAFETFLTGAGLTLETVPVDVLTNVLLAHVVAGEAESTDLSDGQVIPTLNPDVSLTVGISGGTVTVNNATVTTADVDASNGVVHVINAVIQ
jgi:transforming growth factor-beta-induced protein